MIQFNPRQTYAQSCETTQRKRKLDDSIQKIGQSIIHEKSSFARPHFLQMYMMEQQNEKYRREERERRSQEERVRQEGRRSS